MLRTIQDSVVEGNVVADNARGFFVYDAEYNTIRNNLVVGNHVGVHLWAGSIHNAVDGNDFVANREQVRFVAARTNCGVSRRATTGATILAGTGTATAAVTCPSRPTTWWTGCPGSTR